MEKFASMVEVLDFAIKEEQEAYEFYLSWGERVSGRQIQLVFSDLAREEQTHKEKLLGIKRNPQLLPQPGMATKLKIASYIIGEDATVDLDDNDEPGLQQAYLTAIQKEKAAFRMYMDLAKETESQDFKNVLKMLAQEEAMHKLRLELDYEDHFLKEA